MSDNEEEEELVDYSRLLKRGPKRGTTSLEASRQALFECLQSKPKLPKQCSQGILLSRQQPFWTRITINKGTHLRTMGFSDKGTISLFPEEAAFLVSRDALIVKNENDSLLTFQDFCLLLCDKDTDGWITFDKYQVYAYLKRLGYIVTRSKTTMTSEPVTEHTKSDNNSLWDLFCSSLSSWIYKNRKLPLVWDYRYSSYRQVYSTLQIIPSSPWYKPFYKSLTRSFDWDVYKPTSGWKKKNPGIPNFQIIVNDIHDPMPFLHEQNQLFSQRLNQGNDNYQPIKNIRGNGPTFIMALVGDAEGISFLRMIGDGVADIT